MVGRPWTRSPGVVEVARVRRPKDKARVERAVRDVRDDGLWARLDGRLTPQLTRQFALDFAVSSDPAESSPRPRRIAGAKLLARVFALDITRC